MRNYVLPLAFSVFILTGCNTTALTPEEQEPAPESEIAFNGEQKMIDQSQSVISFVGKSNIVNHEGKFTKYDAVIDLDGVNPADLEKASVTATIDLASVQTDAPGLDGHLAKEDFFAADQFPTATFTSTSISKQEGNMYDITGDLTIKGVTKRVTIAAEITNVALTAQYDLPRGEFGIGNDSYGEKLLDPLVPVTIKLVFEQ